MTVAKDMKVNLFADEKMFPELAKAGADGVGHEGPAVGGRLAELPALEAQGGAERQDPHLRGHQGDRQGRQDARSSPTTCTARPASTFYNGGVLVAQAPDIMFLKDSDGGDKADIRVRVLDGMDSADTHHTSNSFSIDPGGAVYCQEGTFHPHPGRNALRPADAQRQRRRLPLRAAHPEVRRLRHLRLRQPARPRLGPLGRGLRLRRHRGQPL